MLEPVAPVRQRHVVVDPDEIDVRIGPERVEVKEHVAAAIARLVPEGSRVLDLGCGDGAMLDYLQRTRGCSGYGIEISDTNVLACVQRGVNVVQLNLDGGLTMFDDASFDVVLQLDTLQHLRNAETMLRETARVADEVRRRLGEKGCEKGSE